MSIRKLSLSLAAALAAIAVTAPQAHAGFIVTFAQVGGNVVATGSGTLNTSALSQGVNPSASDFVIPQFAATILGSSGSYEVFTAITGPSNFGSGVFTSASISSGSLAGLNGFNGELVVPIGYTSGSALSDSATWNSATFSSLGITPGTYVWTWGTGPTADSFTVTTTPEPASLTLFGIGGLALAVFRRRRVES